MRVVVATGNAGKVRELAALLDGAGVELVPLGEFPGAPEVVEDADTYAGNARLKARAAALHTRLPALADDSGLEVDALGGAPGVRSARFAAEHGGGDSDADNVALLLRRLEQVPDGQRGARFRCVIVVATPDGRELIAEGTCEGSIARRPAGDGGFGYDPVFFHPPLRATFAQVDPARKDAVSHRAAACHALRGRLVEFIRGGPVGSG